MPGTAVDQRLEREHLTFALKVHQLVAGDPTTAACWSPFSVASALGLAATGAAGATRAELAALLLGDPDGSLRAHAELLAHGARLDNPGEQAVLGVSNTLWARPDIPVRAEFAEELLAWPGGAIRDAPFTTDPEGARQLVNADVAQATHGLIPQLIPPGTFTADTIATLVNALYLKAAWLNRFPAGGTESRPFHGADGQRDVPTMRQNRSMNYAHAAGWQAVFLPAHGGVEGVVLLPDVPLEQAEPALDAPALAEVLDARFSRKVDLYLPMFKVRSRARLREALNQLGVREMFGGEADFSGISSERLAVSDVVHEAVLTIDEQGLEGAAATAVVMRAMAMVGRPEQPVVVHVDRPFLFLVRHKASGAVHFLARVVRP